MFVDIKPVEDELIDIVDEHDRVIDTAWRSYAAANKVNYRRIVLAFIINNQGKLGLLRRTPHKVYAPSQLALVGGAVQSGETYLQAIKREVAEEVMIDVNRCDLRLLGYRRPEEDNMGYFKTIYEIKVAQETISFNPEDFCELYWLTANEFFQRIEAGDKHATDLDVLVRDYYMNMILK